MRSRTLAIVPIFALSIACGSSQPPPPPPPPPPQAQAEVVVEGEPPPPPAVVVETVPAAPGPEFFWVPGYHRWWGGRYVWVTGRYERRPHSAAVWEGAHWEARGPRHVWIEGHWR
jgi:WXXGXW repeat (2 copies)